MTPEGLPGSAASARGGSPAREAWPQPAVFWRDEQADDLPRRRPGRAPGAAGRLGVGGDHRPALHDQRAQHDQHRGQDRYLGRPDERDPLVRGLVRPVLADLARRRVPVDLLLLAHPAGRAAGRRRRRPARHHGGGLGQGRHNRQRPARSLRSTYEMCAVLAKPEFRIRNRSVPDVWRIKTSTRKPHGHPAEKPEALIRATLAVLDLPPGALVIDPFLGSGTVAATARAAGLSYTGIEADEHWCQAAATRLAAPPPAR